MVSDIILYGGKAVSSVISLKDDLITPTAFINEDFAGIRAIVKNDVYTTKDTDKRCVLAAIRGAKFARELKEIYDDEDLVGCFAGGLNGAHFMNSTNADRLLNELPEYKVNQIRSFVPKYIINMLEALSKNKIPFDSDEIIEEIDQNRIKYSPKLDSILEKNDELVEKIEKEEYGSLSTLDNILGVVGDNFYGVRKIVRPFVDEYLKNFNATNYKVITYGGVNMFGFCILSKWKNDENLDCDLHIRFSTELNGHISDLKMEPAVYNTIRFRKSSEPVHAALFTREFLEKSYGYKERFRLEEKIPVLFRDYDFLITSNNGDVQAIVNDGELIEKIGVMRENIQLRMDAYYDHDVPSIN
jgi:hypothetical protein